MDRCVGGGKEVEDMMMMLMTMVMARESVSGKLLNFKHQKWLSEREDSTALRRCEIFKTHK
jgi:hypothetical protein